MRGKIDERTRIYFDAIKSNLGFVGMNETEIGGIEYILKLKGLESPEKIKTYDGYMNSSNIDVYKYSVNGEIRYCAEFAYQADIDALVYVTIIFKGVPERADVFTVRDMSKMEFDIDFHDLQQEFDCWECGHHVHWLDTRGSLEEKISNAKNKFCTVCDNW